MRLTVWGLHVIRFFESWKSRVYDDVAGNPTIGWGHLITKDDPAEWSDPAYEMSAQDGFKLLQKDVFEAEQALARVFGDEVLSKLNANQYDALVSFIYNLGEGTLLAQGHDTMAAIRALDHGTVPALIRRWTKSGNVVYPGLVARRAVEAWLYSAPVPSASYSISAATLDAGVLADLAKAPKGSSVILVAPAAG